MLTHTEAKQLLETLLGEVWPKGQLDRLKDFYHPDVIGHHNEITFGFDDIKKRMQDFTQYREQCHFRVCSFMLIDDLIVFKMEQTWLSANSDELCVCSPCGAYRMRDDKISELWLLFDEQLPDYTAEAQAHSIAMDDFALTRLDKAAFIKKIQAYSSLGKASQHEALTEMELETLYYYLNGYSAKEIGQILKISNRTVESYIATIKEKYGCSTRRELRLALCPPPGS